MPTAWPLVLSDLLNFEMRARKTASFSVYTVSLIRCVEECMPDIPKSPEFSISIQSETNHYSFSIYQETCLLCVPYCMSVYALSAVLLS